MSLTMNTAENEGHPTQAEAENHRVRCRNDPIIAARQAADGERGPLSSLSKIRRGGAVATLQKWLLAPDETAAEDVGAILGQLGDDSAAVEELLDSDGAVLWLGAVGSEWGLS